MMRYFTSLRKGMRSLGLKPTVHQTRPIRAKIGKKEGLKTDYGSLLMSMFTMRKRIP